MLLSKCAPHLCQQVVRVGPLYRKPSFRQLSRVSQASNFASLTMSTRQVDTIIDAGWVLPVVPDETQVLTDTSVVIHDDVIVDIIATIDVDAKYTSITRLNRTTSIVLPGLINAHTHSGMSLMRGYADDMNLLPWLTEAIWPLESVFSAKPEFCRDGTKLSVAEMIRSGVTCFADMYFYPATAAEVVVETGIRAILGIVVIAFPTAYAPSPEEYIKRGQQARDQYGHFANVHFAYAPHAPYTVSPAIWDRIRVEAEKDDLQIHTHLHETAAECTASKALDRTNLACHTSERACHPIQDFDERGLLSSRLVAVHMVHLTDDEIALCVERGVSIVHCPTSNGKLASGFCRTPDLLKAGVNVALGTDSACSNNSLDLRAEMKMAALIAKNLSGDASTLPAATAVKMATINGARAFGIEHLTGSLECGKKADVICVDVASHAANSPVFDPHSALVYASAREDVRDVLVNGKFLLKDKQYCTLDIAQILKASKGWQDSIIKDMPKKKPPSNPSLS